MAAAPPPSVLDDPDDVDWGRVCGCPPPIGARTPLWFAAVGGAVLVAVVLLLIRLPGPLDERTLADQRNGLVASGPVVSPVVDGVDFGGQAVLLLFQRQVPDATELARWRSGLPADLTVRVVVQVPAGAVPSTVAGVAVVTDPGRVLAEAVALPASRDGEAGVGYAVVDAGRVTRYATLDPSWAGNAFEIVTIVGAVQ